MKSATSFALILAFFAAVPSAFAEPPRPASTPNVFHDDARAPVKTLQAPSNMIGRLELPDGGWCTAGLVYRDLVLTAAHCVIDGTTHQFIAGTYRFDYGMIKDKYRDSSWVSSVWWGTTDTAANRGSDWAILKLTTPLGSKYGWMGVRSMNLTSIYDKGTVGLTAFGSDFMSGETASREGNCSFTSDGPSGTVLHNCDMSRGASGAPMYRAEFDATGRVVYYVLAINVADYRDGKDESLVGIPYSDAHANLAVPASAFVSVLQGIIAQEQQQATVASKSAQPAQP